MFSFSNKSLGEHNGADEQTGARLLSKTEMLKDDENSNQKVQLLADVQEKVSSFKFLVQAGYLEEEALKAVQNTEMSESVKKLEAPIIKSNEKVPTTKLGKVFTLSKKRKVDSKVFEAIRQLNFEASTVKKVQHGVIIEDAGMAIHILGEVQQFLSRQQTQLDNQETKGQESEQKVNAQHELELHDIELADFTIQVHDNSEQVEVMMFLKLLRSEECFSIYRLSRICNF
ncbi:hypothetical protein GOP47_0006482 [Adiantum capillus-veneris]|uniref:Uncharacterized protein n=1 Tax=Adiantum capillus-veneris TaxID=13818 RepID=A0A9D4V2Y9_ADICA|nr:hypothetical protein GOP47_0006482 [Adiantum capillus-veneris]